MDPRFRAKIGDFQSMMIIACFFWKITWWAVFLLMLSEQDKGTRGFWILFFDLCVYFPGINKSEKRCIHSSSYLRNSLSYIHKTSHST